MYVVKTRCWRCNGMMNVAVISGDPMIGNGQVYGPESFSSYEIKLAESNEVIIRKQYSATRQENYLANSCPHCQAFVGQHYLFTEIFCSAQYGDCEYKLININQNNLYRGHWNFLHEDSETIKAVPQSLLRFGYRIDVIKSFFIRILAVPKFFS